MPYPRDDAKFDQHYQCCCGQGDPEIRHEKRQCVVADAAHCGHQSANESSDPWVSSSSKTAVIGECLSKSYADAGTQ